MTLAQVELLFFLINAGIDTALRLQHIVNKILKMSDEECKAFIAHEHARSELLKGAIESA